MALGDVALAPAVMRGIDGEAERRVAVGDRARDVIVGPGRVAADIELEHAQAVGRGLRDIFEARVANRTQHMGDAEFGCAASRHRRGAAGMEALQRADRRQHHRQPQRRPSSSTDASTWPTSRSTRGRKARRSSARRLRRSVVSVSAPPTM